MSQRALIVKFGAIGDVIMALPAARVLHDAGIEIDWVAGRAVRPLLECYSWIHVLPVNDQFLLRGTIGEKVLSILDLWRSIAVKRYDLCATLYYDERYKVLTLPVRAPKRVRLSHVDRQRMLVPGRHHSDEYARIILQSMGRGEDGYAPTSLAPCKPDIGVGCLYPRSGSRRRVALAPGGARNMMRDDFLRRWPLENYVRLAESLLNEGFEVLLVGGTEDAWIESAFADLSINSLVGKLSLPELVSFFDETDIVVTHDTGPLHLAGISNAGLVGIFGPTNPWEKLPRRNGTIALWGGEGFACRPCYDGKDFAPCRHNGCLREITPEVVLQEVMTLANQRAQGSLSPFRIVIPAFR
jgi:heptosyltransferase-2